MLAYRLACKSSAGATALFLATAIFGTLAQAATINFSGFLDIVDVDNGTGVYSGVALGTPFTGFIDDAIVGGSISGGGITTAFGCCIAAGGLSVNNNEVLDAIEAGLLNGLLGSSVFSAGDVVDSVDLEGDVMTASGGRIEIGLSYLLDQNAFSDTSLSNYPFDPNDLKAAVFFILEEDSGGTDIYSAVGLLQPVPVPAAVWLFCSGLLGLIGISRRRFS